MTEPIPSSELIINPDGSAFHLHLLPEQLPDNIILVGDPSRVNLVAEHFDSRTFEVSAREFHSIGGTLRGTPVMALSHGIGPDNIDIVINELDALANIDFATRRPRPEHRTLNLVRIGTSGSLQADIPVGTPVAAAKSIGFDGVLNYYAGRNAVADLEYQAALMDHTKWPYLLPTPYIVNADPGLLDTVAADDMVRGNTISAVGFYGPQGRELRLPLARPDLNDLIRSFSWRGHRVTNYEMESAPLAGLAALLGHRALTVCTIIANRYSHAATPNYSTAVTDLISTVLTRLIP